ncbi:MAG: hypothetical protein GY931_11535 [Maribacter sp.]|nr:hypothetical protein [Maribacter sp.]
MKPIDRDKINDDLQAVCDVGLALLQKDKLDNTDFTKLKTMRAMSTFMNARVAMVQQESASQRIELIKNRMAQLGYNGQGQIG